MRYSMNLKIRDFLQEAIDDVNLPKEPTSAQEVSGAPMSDADFPAATGASDAAPAKPGLTAPQMPSPSGSASNTVQKDVINPELIRAITIPLKSYVGSFEKLFDKDMTVDNAVPHIDEFLKILAGCADSIATLAGGQATEPPIEPSVAQAPIEPTAEPVPTEQPAEALSAPLEAPSAGGQEGYTDPFGHADESPYTNPLEAAY
jgi:hypothetical protein